MLVCAADMPFVTADACRTLIQGAGGSPAVVATAARACCSRPSASTRRRRSTCCAAAEPDAPLTRTVEALDPARVALPPGLVRSVNTPEELAEAEALLADVR